jgi:hypothetical protein
MKLGNSADKKKKEERKKERSWVITQKMRYACLPTTVLLFYQIAFNFLLTFILVTFKR